MRGILANLLVKLGLDSRDFEQGVNKAKNTTNAFGNGLKRIGGMIAGAFAVERLIAFGKELVNLSGQAEGVRKAFERVGSPQLMDDLKKATAGTVSEFELMKRAVMASNFDIPMENLASLLEFATKRAQETGQSVDYLVESIVLGIGRKSPLILDNLGISAVKLRQELKGAGVEMTSVQQVAAAVGKIAAEEMQKSGSIIETNAIKIQNLTAEWNNFKMAIAENQGVKKGIGGILDALQTYLRVFSSDQVTFWGKLVASIDVTGNVFRRLDAELDRLEKNRKDRTQAAIDLNNQFGISVNDLTDTEKKAAEESGKAQMELIAERKKNGQSIAELESETANLEERVKSYGINQTAEIQRTLAQIDANKKLIKSLTTLKKKREEGFPSAATMLKPETNIPGFNVAPELAGQVTLAPEIDKLNAYAEQQRKKAKEIQDKSLEDWNNFKSEMAQMAVDFGTDVVYEFGSAIGEMIATGDFPKDFGKNILAAIGGFITMLGKMLISLGVASEAFQALLKSAFTNPVSAGLAIAAGAALVMLGGAISGAVKAGPTGSTSGSVSTPSYSHSTGGGYKAQSTMNKVVFEIEGTKLKGVLGNVDRKYGLIR